MKKAVLIAMLAVCIGIVPVLPAMAEEQEQMAEIADLNQIMMTTEQVEAKAEPKDSAQTVITYESQAPIFVTGETADGWYRVMYQDQTGYVHKSALTELDMDIEALDKEMAAVEAESKMIIEEVERYRAERRRSRIWGAVIILLVVGIFATGILSTVMSEKKKGEKETEEVKEKEEITAGIGEIIDLDDEESQDDAENQEDIMDEIENE